MTENIKAILRSWLAVSIGSLIGAALIPALLERFARDNSWEAAIYHGVDFVLYSWLPTFIVFSSVLFFLLFLIKRRQDRAQR